MIEKFYLDVEFWFVLVTVIASIVVLISFIARKIKKNNSKRPSVIVDVARSLLPILLIVVTLRSFVVEPFRIPSGSMMPTLEVGDFILVNKFIYGIRLPVFRKKIINISEPKRGDVFVFRYPERPWQNFIKRVVGLPGDTIRWEGSRLYVNDKLITAEDKGFYTAVDQHGYKQEAALYEEDLIGKKHGIILYTQPRGPIVSGSQVVPEDSYFAMGDNRFGSHDSRFWGFVPKENLVGKAMIIWMHWASKNGGIDASRIGTVIK